MSLHESPYPGRSSYPPVCESERLTRLEERHEALVRRFEDVVAMIGAAATKADNAATRESLESVRSMVREALDQAKELTEARAARNHGDIEGLQKWRLQREAADLERDRISRQTRWLVTALLTVVGIGIPAILGVIEATHP